MKRKIVRMLVIVIVALTGFFIILKEHSQPSRGTVISTSDTNADFDFTSPMKIVLVKLH